MKILSLILTTGVLLSGTIAFADRCEVVGRFPSDDEAKVKKHVFKSNKPTTAGECFGFAARVFEKTKKKLIENYLYISFDGKPGRQTRYAMQIYTQSVKASTSLKAGCNVFNCHPVGEWGYCNDAYPKVQSVDQCLSVYENAAKDPGDGWVSGAYLAKGYVIWFPSVP